MTSTPDITTTDPTPSRSRRVPAIAATVALVSGSLLASSGPVDAALTTRCVGEAAGVAIPGDLVVPAGEACALFGSSVQGSVTVRNGANLLLADGTHVAGGALVARDGFLDVLGSSIDGPVEGRSPFALVLDSSSLGQELTVRGRAGQFPPVLYTSESNVGGSVDARSGHVIFATTTISGSVATRNADYTDVLDSTVFGDLTVRSNAAGSVVCESEVDGDALFQGNGEGLQIGGTGQLGVCDGPTYWGGNVVVRNNSGPVYGIDVTNNIIRGSLSGNGNDPAPTGSMNRVRGGVSGQFENLVPAEATMSRQAATPAGRLADVQAALDARRGVVVDEVEVLGEAELEPATAEDLTAVG